MPPPCQSSGDKRKRMDDDNFESFRAQKVARMSSGATIGAAIVKFENSVETEVCLLLNAITNSILIFW